MEFNAIVHQQDEHGDPVRNEDGEIRLKTNWKTEAKDIKGRSYNPRVHGGEQKLDEQGFLKVPRRDAERTPMSATNRSEAFVEKHREPGYAYYLMADDPGRQGQFEDHDYEPVIDENGPAVLSGGQGRTPTTQLKLMKKPQEWYDEDQKAKADAIDEVEKGLTRDADLEPDVDGQYGSVKVEKTRR